MLSVYVIVTVPAVTPVTTPVLFTVAIEVLDEVHGLVVAAVPEPVKVVVLPAQTLEVPDIETTQSFALLDITLPQT